MANITDNFSAVLEALSGPKAVELVSQALYSGAQKIQTDAQISLTEGAQTGKGHVPSLPGEPPNQDTGYLGSHIEASQPDGPMGLRARVASEAEYAQALEYGTSKMAERPYMRPAAEKNRAEVTKLVAQAVEKATGTSGISAVDITIDPGAAG